MGNSSFSGSAVLGPTEGSAADETAALGKALDDESAAAALARSGALTAEQFRAFRQLAEQAVTMGVDYATLGLGWEHPTSRCQYREATQDSIACAASRARAARSRAALVALAGTLAGGGGGADADAALADAFAREVSASSAARAGADAAAVRAALAGELVLPLRALNEDRGRSMTLTFNKVALPAERIAACVDAITSHVLDGSYARWRYGEGNPVGARQLEGLSDEQKALWAEPTRSEAGGGVVVHEDAPGELGLFWATKIGGPSHGFDYEGQCLLPLLANARHKVLLVSDPSWAQGYPTGRCHFRLLWEGDAPCLWVEGVHADFCAPGGDGWDRAVIAHACRKAEAMACRLSVEEHQAGALREVAADAARVRAGARQRLTLRPSNGVVEASDYLSSKHDWLQIEEETTSPLRRCVYDPPGAAAP